MRVITSKRTQSFGFTMPQRLQEHQGTSEKKKKKPFLIDLMAHKHLVCSETAEHECASETGGGDILGFVWVCVRALQSYWCFVAEYEAASSNSQQTTGNRQCCCWRERRINFLLLLSSLVGVGSHLKEPFPSLISGSCFWRTYYKLLRLDLCSNELGGVSFFLAQQGHLGDEAFAAKAGGQGSGEELII